MARVSTGTTLPRPPGLRGPLTQRRLVRAGALGGSLVLLGLLPTLLGGPVWLRAAGLVPGFGIVYATPTPTWSVELVAWVLLNLIVLLAVGAGLLTGLQRIMTKGDHLTLPAVVIASMLLAAILAAVHDGHGHAQQEWVPVAEVLAVIGTPAALLIRERRRGRSARRVGDARQGRLDAAAREEWRPGRDERADEDDRARLARWAETLALQPAHEWNGFGAFGDEYLLPATRSRSPHSRWCGGAGCGTAVRVKAMTTFRRSPSRARPGSASTDPDVERRRPADRTSAGPLPAEQVRATSVRTSRAATRVRRSSLTRMLTGSRSSL